MCKAIKTLAEKYPETDFVYPMHLNRTCANRFMKFFGNSDLQNMFFSEPLEYLPFVYLMEKSAPCAYR